MSTSPIQRHHAVPASHRGVVLAVWAVATLAVAVLGWLVLALSERGGDRLAGGLLLLAGGVPVLAGVVTAGLVLRSRRA